MSKTADRQDAMIAFGRSLIGKDSGEQMEVNARNDGTRWGPQRPVHADDFGAGLRMMDDRTRRTFSKQKYGALTGPQLLRLRSIVNVGPRVFTSGPDAVVRALIAKGALRWDGGSWLYVTPKGAALWNDAILAARSKGYGDYFGSLGGLDKAAWLRRGVRAFKDHAASRPLERIPDAGSWQYDAWKQGWDRARVAMIAVWGPRSASFPGVVGADDFGAVMAKARNLAHWNTNAAWVKDGKPTAWYLGELPHPRRGWIKYSVSRAHHGPKKGWAATFLAPNAYVRVLNTDGSEATGSPVLPSRAAAALAVERHYTSLGGDSRDASFGENVASAFSNLKHEPGQDGRYPVATLAEIMRVHAYNAAWIADAEAVQRAVRAGYKRVKAMGAHPSWVKQQQEGMARQAATLAHYKKTARNDRDRIKTQLAKWPSTVRTRLLFGAEDGPWDDAEDRGAAAMEVANPEWAEDYGDDEDDLHAAFHEQMEDQGVEVGARALSGLDAMQWMNALAVKTGGRNRAYYMALHKAVKQKIIGPSAVVGSGYKNPHKVALAWIDEQLRDAFGADRWPLAHWNKWDTRDWPNGQRGYGYTVRGSYNLTWAIVPAGSRRWNLNVTNKHGFAKTWGPFKNPTAAAEAKRHMLAGGMAEKIKDVDRYTDPRGFGAVDPREVRVNVPKIENAHTEAQAKKVALRYVQGKVTYVEQYKPGAWFVWVLPRKAVR